MQQNQKVPSTQQKFCLNWLQLCHSFEAEKNAVKVVAEVLKDCHGAGIGVR